MPKDRPYRAFERTTLLIAVLPQPKEGHLVRVVLLPMGRIRSHRIYCPRVLS